jgi:hypothetical protein
MKSRRPMGMPATAIVPSREAMAMVAGCIIERHGAS